MLYIRSPKKSTGARTWGGRLGGQLLVHKRRLSVGDHQCLVLGAGDHPLAAGTGERVRRKGGDGEARGRTVTPAPPPITDKTPLLCSIENSGPLGEKIWMWILQIPNMRCRKETSISHPEASPGEVSCRPPKSNRFIAEMG